MSPRFRRAFARLPRRIQEQTRRAYRLFQASSDHPGLEFKKLPPHDDIWSARVTDQYRVVETRTGDTIIWFFIGSHAEYDKLLDRL